MRSSFESAGGAWEFPSGALLTAAIVAMVLSPLEPWHVTTLTAVIGVVSKYVFRVRTANVFNPAALGLLVTFYVFDTGQSWWGALGDVTPWAILLLVATGAFITDRVNKFPMVLAFLGVYYLLFTVDGLRRRSRATGRDLTARRICRPCCTSRSSS